MSPAKRVLLFGFAAVHLGLIALSSAKIGVGKWVQNPVALSVVDVYSYVSGAGYHYGFFAPGVTSQLKVLYRCRSAGVLGASGELKTHNIETTFRLHNLLEFFWEVQEKPAVRRAFAASLAGKVFARHPEADSVEIEVEAFVLPSMAEIRSGAAPSWEKHYLAEFDRDRAVRGVSR